MYLHISYYLRPEPAQLFILIALLCGPLIPDALLLAAERTAELFICFAIAG